VTDPTRVWVRGDVPELEIARVQLGSAVIVRLHAFPDLALPGTIVYVAPPSTSARARCRFASPSGAPTHACAAASSAASRWWAAPQTRACSSCPSTPSRSSRDRTTVFVPGGEANTFRPQAVALGRRAGGFYEVREGLAEGGPLAVSGAFTLKSALRSGELSEAALNVKKTPRALPPVARAGVRLRRSSR
jgi:hypothetical protein